MAGKLMKVLINDDFDLKKIEESGQCFRVRELKDGTWRFIHLNRVLYIRKNGDREYEVNASQKDWEEIWIPYFDLERDYEELRRLIPEEDGFMRRAAEYGKGIRVLRQDPWEMLITFIISQRKNIPAITKSVELLCDMFGKEVPGEEIKLFPTVNELSAATEEELNLCKLGYRTPYILDATEKVRNGDIDLCKLDGLDDEALFEELKRVRGVGDKVANCVCLFAYHRTSMVPVDTWIARIIDLEYNGKNPFARYKENGGIMQQWAFYYARSIGNRK